MSARAHPPLKFSAVFISEDGELLTIEAQQAARKAQRKTEMEEAAAILGAGPAQFVGQPHVVQHAIKYIRVPI